MAERYFPWSVLGIDRTDDVIAVKQAYAAKLKTTRPDDDAEGYQRLRSAYETALQAARRGALDGFDSGAAAPANSFSEGDSEISVSPQAQAADAAAETYRGSNFEGGTADNLVTFADAGDLADELLQCWRKGGETALAAEWPRFELQLKELPFSERTHASVIFARLVVGHIGLPPGLLLRLDEHFDWQRDFRVQRLLGISLVSDLEKRLANISLHWRNREQASSRLAEYHEARLLAELYKTSNGLSGWLKRVLFVLLASERLPHSVNHTDNWTLQGLGIPASIANRIRRIANLAYGARILLLPVFLVAPAAWYLSTEQKNWWHASILAFMLLVVGGALNATIVGASQRNASKFFDNFLIAADPTRDISRPLFHFATIAAFAMAFGATAMLKLRFGADWPSKSGVAIFPFLGLMALGIFFMQQGRTLAAEVVLPLLIYFSIDLYALSGSSLDVMFAVALPGIVIASSRAILICRSRNEGLSAVLSMVFLMIIIFALVVMIMLVSLAQPLENGLWQMAAIALMAYSAHFVQRQALSARRRISNPVLWVPVVLLVHLVEPRPPLTICLAISAALRIGLDVLRNRLLDGPCFRTTTAS